MERATGCDNLKFRFNPAGHILGSAYIEFECHVGQQKERILFSGDLGAPYARYFQHQNLPGVPID